MDLRTLGKLLSANGYIPMRVGHNRLRGYIVLERANNQPNASALVKEAIKDHADIADMIF